MSMNFYFPFIAFYMFLSIIRGNLKQLLKNLNCQKNHIKQHGVQVDGKSYNIKFTGTAYYLVAIQQHRPCNSQSSLTSA